MGIASSLKSPPQGPCFPFLGLCAPRGAVPFVVLFTGERTGVVVQIDDGGPWALGYVDSAWYMPAFVPFQGEVTLRNA